MKICKDCKWHKPRGFDVSSAFDLCAHPKLSSIVNGEPYEYCEQARAFIFGKCGFYASLFEPKEKNQ